MNVNVSTEGFNCDMKKDKEGSGWKLGFYSGLEDADITSITQLVRLSVVLPLPE
jgi:hypothetical protein